MSCGRPVTETPEHDERWRLFIAIPLPTEQQAALREAAARLRRSVDAPMRWGVENAHLTLRFLGETVNGRAGAVAAALCERATPLPSFTLHLAGAGCFPPGGPVQVAWAVRSTRWVCCTGRRRVRRWRRGSHRTGAPSPRT